MPPSIACSVVSTVESRPAYVGMDGVVKSAYKLRRFLGAAMGNTCNCPKPPGGQVICSANQLAICGIREGRIVSGCYDKPDYASRIEEQHRLQVQRNWALAVITATPRDDYAELSSEDYQILRQGSYQDPSRKYVVTFSLPEDIRLAALVTA